MPTPNTQLSCFVFPPCPNLVNSELGQRHSSNTEQNMCKRQGRARQWALSNLVSDELQRISKWVSAAEVVLRVKAVRQGRQGGFLKGNIRGAEPKEMDPKQLSFKNKVLIDLNNCVKLVPVRSSINNTL